MNRNPIVITLSLLILLTLTAGLANAEPRHERKGFFMGLDLGSGGSGFRFERDGVEHEYEDDTGLAAGLRLGYAFNPYFSLSIEGHCYEHHGDDFDYHLGSGLLAATIYPAGGGFFLRIGAGDAEFKTELNDENDDPLIEEFEVEGGAILLGLGYDWMVNEHFAVGLSMTANGAGFDDFQELEKFEETIVGQGSLGLTMNYYF